MVDSGWVVGRDSCCSPAGRTAASCIQQLQVVRRSGRTLTIPAVHRRWAVLYGHGDVVDHDLVLVPVCRHVADAGVGAVRRTGAFGSGRMIRAKKSVSRQFQAG